MSTTSPMTTKLPGPIMAQPKFHVRRFLLRWEFLLSLVLLLDIVVNALSSAYFLDPWTLSDASFNFTEKAIIALPMALLVIAAEIDVSVAAIVALASVSMGTLASLRFTVPVLVAGALATGLFAGALNGTLVTFFRVPAIVATIATMTLYRGLAFAILGDQVINSYPEEFAIFGQGYAVGPVSIELVLFTVLALITGVILHWTVIGRRIYAIGSNEIAARSSGVRVKQYKFWLFVTAGMASGFASILLTSRLGSTRPSIAEGWELEVITMVILGGVSMDGGVGSILGVVLAAILMGMVIFGLGLLNVPGIVMSIVTGTLLIVIVAVPAALRRLHLLR